jgi:hypothetical protein
MGKIIAVVGLSKGYYAYYDEISRISIDLTRPSAPVYAGTDVSGLKRAIGNTLYLISGSLTEEPKAEVKVEAKAAEVKEPEAKPEVKVEVEAVKDEEKSEDVVAAAVADKKIKSR